MARDPNMPNKAANKEKAEGDRWTSDDNTVERRDRDTGGKPRPGEDIVGRTPEERPTTPRQYEYEEDTDDPVLPDDDPALRTEM